MRNIKINIVGIYQTVIADNRNVLRFGFLHHRSGLRRIVRRDDQNINALRQKIINIVCLFVRFVIGDGDQDIRPAILCNVFQKDRDRVSSVLL